MNLTVGNGNFATDSRVQLTGTGSLPSAFDVTGLAVASMAAAGTAVAQLCGRLGNLTPAVAVDRALASAWFGLSFRPDGWDLPPVWDSIAGDYPTADGWIRLHTNAPHHRAAALAVLGLPAGAEREHVARAVASRSGVELEDAIVAANGCAAVMHSRQQWLAHPQGAAIAAEPLVHWGPERRVPPFGRHDAGARRVGPRPAVTPARPLAGVRVLDLTRVIAGPVATRFLALYGADVLRIDPPDWIEPGLEPEMTLGKHCARLDVKSPSGLARLEELLAGADIFIHGYRPDALDRLGLSDAVLAGRHPALVNVALDAYGWTGPWAQRRGFDSLVQMSCGIAHAGMEHFGRDLPFPLPVQALDHATGYLTAAAAIDAWRERLDGRVRNARLSLARTAVELMRTGPSLDASDLPAAESFAWEAESTGWGPGQRLPQAVVVDGVPARTSVEARGYGSAVAAWAGG
ncbi:crotonobetainyl-CoA:carnitine CoA-transferase CaiB-like acyl-CoA transferase [Arthrobacter silviterrae]|uniref:Acyl-CoA transferase n=1 Tax=Arthrobacter silviterrae TaxID=2026658 RepID=A0ABX0D5B7_9MICC|nr:CoA transferase [Arthrobacter silviterrae]MDQ0279436.1 crotonobetainyl-CoA:carnitine CoA-transferase CaiB-like acyl-CoA transferase [Arthrobacter silviterrae]NGN82084.1 acyl-CoA transferase [Arthrobacter silviterrae]